MNLPIIGRQKEIGKLQNIHPFAIDKKYAANLGNKIDSFKTNTKTKKAIFLTMISTYGIANNQYAGMVQNDLTMDILFEK